MSQLLPGSPDVMIAMSMPNGVPVNCAAVWANGPVFASIGDLAHRGCAHAVGRLQVEP